MIDDKLYGSINCLGLEFDQLSKFTGNDNIQLLKKKQERKKYVNMV